MAKRLQIEADERLLREVEALLPPGKELPAPTRLEYWRHWEYIPSERDGRGPGSTLSYPPGTARQVVALMRELEQRRDLNRAALSMFFANEGYKVGAKALRRAVLAELDRCRIGIEKYGRTWGGQKGRPPRPAETALALADRATYGRTSAGSVRQRTVVLDRLDKPAWFVLGDSPAERLWSAVAGLTHGVLAGWTQEDFANVLYLLFVAIGGEDALAAFLPEGFTTEQASRTLFSEDANTRVSLVSDATVLSILSLPGLKRQLGRMSAVDFERAREDTPLLVDLGSFAARALMAMLPPAVSARLARLDGVEWRALVSVAGLPLMYGLRRLNAVVLEANLAVARQDLPAWEADLKLGEEAGLFANADFRAQLLIAVTKAIRAAMDEEGS